MGMLVGKVAHETMIVMDTFPLLVEGTEVRVNPQVIQCFLQLECYLFLRLVSYNLVDFGIFGCL